MKPSCDTVLITTIIFVGCFILFTESTLCKPLSTFKIDCNVCKCNTNGREYSCTERQCPAVDWSKFEEEVNEEGYVLLKPKQTVKSNDDDFVLTRKVRQATSNSDDSFLILEDEEIDISNYFTRNV